LQVYRHSAFCRPFLLHTFLGINLHYILKNLFQFSWFFEHTKNWFMALCLVIHFKVVEAYFNLLYFSIIYYSNQNKKCHVTYTLMLIFCAYVIFALTISNQLNHCKFIGVVLFADLSCCMFFLESIYITFWKTCSMLSRLAHRFYLIFICKTLVITPSFPFNKTR
jgi:hypothetical protein